MWQIITVAIMAVELVLLLLFVIGKFHKRNMNETALFLAVVFIVNLALHYVPFLYSAMVLKTESNYLLGLMDSFGASLKLFVGEPKVETIKDLTAAVPLFGFVYFLGLAMALLATVSTAVEVFNHTLHNGVRLHKYLKKSSCDIVLGNSAKALQYAKAHSAVVVLDDSVPKDVAVKLMEEGYAVLRKNFSETFFRYRRFVPTSRYNIICPDSEPVLDRIETFIAYRAENPEAKNFYLYAEVEEDGTETVRREIIEKSGFGAWISTFCTNELLARTFAEQHPITRYIPKSFVDNAAIKPDVKLNIFLLGFGRLGKELYRQCVLTNQLVTYTDGAYRQKNVNYYICDTGIDPDSWSINGLREAIQELDQQAHFPLPEMPYETKVIDKEPTSRSVLNAIKKQVQRNNSYTMIIVNTEEDCCNIDIGAKLKTHLLDATNYRIFVRSESSFVKNSGPVCYFGKTQDVFTHDVIVDEDISTMAKKVNEVYTAHFSKEDRNAPDFEEKIAAQAEADWNKNSYLMRQSNTRCAMNLRVILNLLGLDMKDDGKGENISLIHARYPRKESYEYSECFSQSIRSALIAQEHARWNAFHLLNEYLPMEKAAVTLREKDDKKPYDQTNKPEFNTKNHDAKRHSCLTTHAGLNLLAKHLADMANQAAGEEKYEVTDYEYYTNDELLIVSVEELMRKLKYSITEK